MLSVTEALEQIRAHCERLPVTPLATREALGLVLAEPVVSDVDSPPHDKSLVDGYAVRAADTAAAPCQLRVLEEVVAGGVPTQPLTAGAATRIMTGAPLPDHADAVVMIEQTELLEDGSVRVNAAVGAEQNVLRRGTSLTAGQQVLSPGHRIQPATAGLLSEVGRETVQVARRPRVAVLTTGDELVPPGQRPGPGQIRNSNGPMLEACIRAAGAEPLLLPTAPDQLAPLQARVSEGLAADLLLLSGGVSAGVKDLVPQALQACGVEAVFHKVKLKPGKPLWFGLRAQPARCLVFGLPGNPVSSLVCFELFVRPALSWICGSSAGGLRQATAQIAEAYTHRGDRPTYYPAASEWRDGQLWLRPLDWKGSADLKTVAMADCLAYFPPGEHALAPGDPVEVRLLA